MPRDSHRLNDVFDLSFTQADVDFVIPDLGQDLRLAIDPFLLFKSRLPRYREAHDQLLSIFNEAIHRFGGGDEEGASRLIQFPEVNEIGFGYTASGIRGSGLGSQLNQLILETFGASPDLVRRGVRHVEEMQLVSLGIGPDRISDIAANALKHFLITYTQEQAEQWHIPIHKAVPVHHVFDFDGWQWTDGYYDVPINPVQEPPTPLLLVPRRFVRLLPWINFGDYQRQEFGTFLRAQDVRRKAKRQPQEAAPNKREIVAVTRREVARIDHYVDRKEEQSDHALPATLVSATTGLCDQTEHLIDELASLKPGMSDAEAYQELMLRIMNVLFEPDLIEGSPQMRTVSNTEIRDLIFINDSDKRFWDFVRNQHGGLSVVFELKNKTKLDGDDFDQLAGYLGDPLGYFGVLVSRKPWPRKRLLNAISWYNKGTPHRVIIGLSDEDVVRMLQLRCAGHDATPIVRQAYRDLMAKIQ